MSVKHLYTCKECRFHEFNVIEEGAFTQYFISTLSCDCENNEDIAAEYTYLYVTQLRKIGALDKEHRWVYDKEQEEVIDEREYPLMSCNTKKSIIVIVAY